MFLIEVPRYLEVVCNSVLFPVCRWSQLTDVKGLPTTWQVMEHYARERPAKDSRKKTGGGGVVKGMEFQDLVMQREGLENKQKHKKQWTLMREYIIEQLTIL